MLKIYGDDVKNKHRGRPITKTGDEVRKVMMFNQEEYERLKKYVELSSEIEVKNFNATLIKMIKNQMKMKKIYGDFKGAENEFIK